MSAHKIYPVRDNISNTALINKDSYLEMYEASISEPDKFWAEQAEKFLTWDASWSEICSENFLTGDAKWFLDGKLNVSANCIDRHLTDNREKIAIIWEGDSPEDSKHISYEELYSEVCKLGNLLRARGVKKGDRVCIYMPMVPEAAYAMLACTRIGAIHSVVFGGFSPEALKDRILDSNCKVVISANEGIRGGKSIPLKRNVDLALTDCPSVHTLSLIHI